MTHGTGFGTLVYDGPMPADRWTGIPSGTQRDSFVYVLFGDRNDGRAIYIGKSRTPGQRFDRHVRQPWWLAVKTVRIYRVTGASRYEAEHQALAAETRAIAELDPLFNAARTSWGWV